jgi:hypothetical protein
MEDGGGGEASLPASLEISDQFFDEIRVRGARVAFGRPPGRSVRGALLPRELRHGSHHPIPMGEDVGVLTVLLALAGFGLGSDTVCDDKGRRFGLRPLGLFALAA